VAKMEVDMKETNKLKTVMTPQNIIGIVLIVLFLPMIIINLIIVVKGAIHPEQVPMVFNTAPLVVISDSMTIDKEAGTGEFNKGDLIIIKKVDPATLQKNDVICYMIKDSNGIEVVTHRITNVVEENGTRKFETKGDASPGYDYNLVTYDQVVGIYKSRIAGVGKIAEFLRKPIGNIVVLGIPVLAFFVIDFIFRKKEQNKTEDKTRELEAELEKLKAEKAQQESENKKEENSDSN